MGRKRRGKALGSPGWSKNTGSSLRVRKKKKKKKRKVRRRRRSLASRKAESAHFSGSSRWRAELNWSVCWHGEGRAAHPSASAAAVAARTLEATLRWPVARAADAHSSRSVGWPARKWCPCPRQLEGTRRVSSSEGNKIARLSSMFLFMLYFLSRSVFLVAVHSCLPFFFCFFFFFSRDTPNEHFESCCGRCVYFFY